MTPDPSPTPSPPQGPAPEPQAAPSPQPQPATAPQPAPPFDPPPLGDEPRAFSDAERTPGPPKPPVTHKDARHVPIYGDMWGTGKDPRPYDLPGLAPDFPEPQAPQDAKAPGAAAAGPKPGPGQFSAPQPAEGDTPVEPVANSVRP
jgi:hypothetical protein